MNRKFLSIRSLLLMVCLSLDTAASAGCAAAVPTATVALPTASSTPPPTATDMPSATATPTYALTPAAVMGLDEAKRIVLGWLDPEREPRVEMAYYVTEDEVADVIGDQNERGLRFTLRTHPSEREDLIDDFPERGSPRLLLMVEASTLGMDVIGLTALATRPNRCDPVSSAARQGVLAVWDASTGSLLGATPVYRYYLDWIARLRPVGRTTLVGSTPLATRTGVPTPAMTRSEKASSDTIGLPDLPRDAGTPRSLGEGEVPPALVDAAREYPLVVGSSWTFKRSWHEDGIRWGHGTYTLTIGAAWQIAPDVMAIRTEGIQSHTLYLLPHGVVGGLLPGLARFYMKGFLVQPEIADMRRDVGALASPNILAEEGVPDDAIQTLLMLPVRSGVHISYLRKTEGAEDLQVPAGRFEGCVRLREICCGGNVWTSWVCPGVGFVKHDMPGCGSMGGGYSVDELVRYHIPPLRPISDEP